MGYYTEFRCRVTLMEDTPELIINTLDSIINDYSNYWETLTGSPMPMMSSVAENPQLPIFHPFGNCSRWNSLFHSRNFDDNIEGSSFNKETRELSIHSEFKDYEDEIRLFIKWIRDFIDMGKEVILWSKGEDCDEKDDLTKIHGLCV